MSAPVLPESGEGPGWGTKVNDAIESIYSTAANAKANADSAQSNANEARNVAYAVKEFVEAPTDERVGTALANRDLPTTGDELSASIDQRTEATVPGLVTDALAADDAPAQAAAVAVDAALGEAGVLHDAYPLSPYVDDSTDVALSITDQSGRRSWLEVAKDGGPTAHARAILEAIASALDVGDGKVVLNSLSAAVSELLFTPHDDQTGWSLPITDAANRLAGGVRNDGVLEWPAGIVAPGLGTDHEVRNATPLLTDDHLVQLVVDDDGNHQIQVTTRASGVATLLTTEGDNIAPQFAPGDLVTYRTNRGSADPDVYVAEARPLTGGDPVPVVSTADLVSEGDSLLAANPIGDAADILGVPHTNRAIGGTSINSVAARQGATPSLLTVSGDAIPASGPVTVTNLTVRMLSSGASPAATRTLVGTLAGVPGTLTKTGTADVDEAYTFTRTTAGDAVACPAGTPFHPTADYLGHTQVFWPGRNPVNRDVPEDPANYTTMRTQVAAMAAFLTPLEARFLVISGMPARGERSGTDVYDELMAMNVDLAATYGERYIDVNRYLIDHGLAHAGITPTATDISDLSYDVVPQSLKSDDVHLNDDGNAVVSDLVVGHLVRRLGWYPTNDAAEAAIATLIANGWS